MLGSFFISFRNNLDRCIKAPYLDLISDDRDRLIGLGVSVFEYWSWGHGLDSRHLQGSTQPREYSWVAA